MNVLPFALKVLPFHMRLSDDRSIEGRSFVDFCEVLIKLSPAVDDTVIDINNRWGTSRLAFCTRIKVVFDLVRCESGYRYKHVDIS
jgi:hypothetical protein